MTTVTVTYDLNDSLHFPPLSKRYAKQHHKKLGRRRGHDNDIETSRNRIDDLNDTLVELIFVRVSPWKYLIRSKSVSKRWNSIISNPDFIRTLTQENHPFTLLLRRPRIDLYGQGKCVLSEHPHVQNHKLNLDFFPANFYWHHETGIIDIVAHNNDVLVSWRTLNSQDNVECCIANPLTKQYVVVSLKPPVIYFGGHYWILTVGILTVGVAGFVEGVSSVTATMNPHDVKRGFRIVQVINVNHTILVLHIYSSETGQCTTYSFDINVFDSCFRVSRSFNEAKTLNNKIHWFVPPKILVINPFDVDNEPPHTLNLPKEIDYNDSVLDVCQNQLRIALLQKKQADEDYQRIKVWEIEHYDSCYDAKLRLVIDLPMKRSIIQRDLSPIYSLCPTRYTYYHPDKVICCHPNDPHVVYFCYENVLYYYDDFRKRCKVVSYYTSDWTERFVLMHPLVVQ